MAGREGVLKAAGEAARSQMAASASLHLAVAAKSGLGPADALAYDLIRRRGPLMAGEIGQATGLTSGSVTALIDRLEARGFVQRVREGADRRRVFVYADPAGMAALAPPMAGFEAELDALNAGYDDAALRLLAGYLFKLTVLAEKAMETLDQAGL